MKKFLSTLAVVLITCQTFAIDLYCTPTGGVIPTGPLAPLWGRSFYYAYSPYDLMHQLGTNTSLDSVNIYFSRGTYTDVFHFNSTTVLQNVLKINMYGGFHESINVVTDTLDLINRNLPTDETVFLVNQSPSIIYHCSWFAGETCIIDGITMHGATDNLTCSAMELYHGNHLMSHLKFSKILTTGPLLWIEYGNSYKCILNSVIEENTASYMLPAYCNLDIINCTIAENYWYDDFIHANLLNKAYAIYNSIIHKNNTCSMGDINEYVHVNFSIIDYYDSSWMGDDGNNYWGYDPQFIFLTPEPHICYNTSIAINNGKDSYITTFPYTYPFCLAYYEVNMHPRFYHPYTILDIGAYQHLYDYQSSYYYDDEERSAPGYPQTNKKEMLEPTSNNDATYNHLGQPVDETYHGIVIQNGQKRVQ